MPKPVILAAASLAAWLAVPLAAGAGHPMLAAALFIGAGLGLAAAFLAALARIDSHVKRESEK